MTPLAPAPSVRHWRGPLYGLLAVGIGCLFAGVLLEILLRVHNPFFARVKGNRIVLEANRTVRFRNPGSVPGLERDITVTRNSIGLRGPNPPADPGRHLGLITIGGSTTFCSLASDKATWTAVMTPKLGASFRDLWINNAGLDGHTSFGHRIMLEDTVAPLKPKVAVFLVGMNDIAVAAPSTADAENVQGWHTTDMKGIFKAAAVHSEVLSMFLNLYRAYLAWASGLGHSQLELKELGEVPLTEAEVRERSAVPRDLLDGYRQRLEALVRVSREKSILPVFVTQPSLFGEGVDDVTGVDLAKVRHTGLGRFIAGAGNGAIFWRRLEQYNDVMRGVCAAKGVSCIELARTLPKSSRIYYDGVHFTVAGNQEVARIVGKGLCPVLRENFPAYQTAPCLD